MVEECGEGTAEAAEGTTRGTNVTEGNDNVETKSKRKSRDFGSDGGEVDAKQKVFSSNTTCLAMMIR